MCGLVGPNFGTEPLIDTIAGSPDLATFVGEQTRLVWPADYDLRRVAVRGPAWTPGLDPLNTRA